LKNRKKEPKKQVSFRLPQSLIKEVKILAGLLDIPQSDLAQQALRRFNSGYNMKTGQPIMPSGAGQQALHPEELILFSDLINCSSFSDDESLFRATDRDWYRMVWVNDANCECSHANWKVSMYTGRSRDELLKAAWIRIIHNEDQNKVLKNVEASFQDRRPFCNLYRMLRVDDYFGWVLDQGMPRYRNGEFIGYVGTFYEIAMPGTLPSPEFVAFQRNYSHAAHKRVASAISLYSTHSLSN